MKNYFNNDLKEYCYFTESNSVKTGASISECTISDFYVAVDFVLSHFSKCEIKEVVSNTLNCEKQNIFQAIREYHILKNGHYKTIKVYLRGFGGCCITESK